MDRINNIPSFKIYVDVIPVSDGEYVFISKDKQEINYPEFDFHLPVFLTRSTELFNYVQIDREEKIMPIPRQEFNPYFIEFGFFDTIQRNKVNYGRELTSSMIGFIKNRRSDIDHFSDREVRVWFDEVGINEFPWNKGTSSETNIDDIDEFSFVAENIVSKAKYLNIDINK